MRRIAAPSANIRVGLLGGSFNPAHEGHLHISIEALHRLGLDQVWWLVTPQNPLKSNKGMAPLAQRMQKARELTAGTPGIHVTDIERKLRTTYTIHTIRLLQRQYPHIKFVWLMGADNLQQFHRWYRWQDIFARIPVAIFDRSPFTYEAISGKAGRRFAQYRVGHRQAGTLALMKPPAWGYMHIFANPASSTHLRETTAWLNKGN